MIENRMVIDSEWPEETEDDHWDTYGTESTVMDCLYDEEKVHMFMESYLSVDDLEEQEIKCEAIFSAMCAQNPISFHDDFRKWVNDNADSLRDLFNGWYEKKYN